MNFQLLNFGKTVYDYFVNILNKGHERSVIVKKNIAFSIVLKGINVAIQLLMVPLLLGYLNSAKYGIWITMWTAVNWINYFDIGFGNGLRNKLTEAFAKNEIVVAKIYVSTTYAIVSLISVIIFLFFIIANYLLDWPAIFNAPVDLIADVNTLIFVLFILISVNFIVRLIGSILYAEQKSSINDLISVISNVLSLLSILVLTKLTNGSLIFVGIIFGVFSFLPAAIASILLFSGKYKAIKPDFRSINLGYVNGLTTIGLKFFIMQIGSVIMFTTDNMIISHLFGPSEVTPYTIALKYFNIVQMGFVIILIPLYSTFTEAYTKNDTMWIKNKIILLIKIWGVILLLLSIMLLAAKPIYKIWVGDLIDISFSLSFCMAIYVAISTWNNIFTTFLMSIGKIWISFYISIIIIIIQIPLAIWFSKYLGFGVKGVIMATTISLLLGAILQPIQYYKIINKASFGKWNK